MREDKEFHNSSLVVYCIVWSVKTEDLFRVSNKLLLKLKTKTSHE